MANKFNIILKNIEFGITLHNFWVEYSSDSI